MEQEIVYERLPTDVAERYVLLMDPILGTGSSASRAVRVLLDKGCDEGRIMFVRWAGGRTGGRRARRQLPLGWQQRWTVCRPPPARPGPAA